MPRAQRKEFSKQTKRQAWERCGGRCECGCGLPIQGTPEYDHIQEDYVSKDNSLSNCQVLSARCHRLKTAAARPQIDRTRRLEEKRLGLRAKGRGFRTPPPGYNAWTRRIEGDD